MFKKKTIDDLISTKSIKAPKTMAEVDKLSGKDFEIFISDYFKQVYSDVKKVELTDDTGDKGLDLLIDFENDTRFGIQAKRWKSPIGSVEVSKMLRGKSHYKVNKLYFITNSTLTSQAKTAAFNEEIEVWDRDKVVKMLFELNSSLGTITEDKEETKYIVDEYFDKLKEIRKEISSKYNLYPIYTVFTDKTINDIIKINPRKISELDKISGLGEKKIKIFGEYLITRINELHKNVKSSGVRFVNIKNSNNNIKLLDDIKLLRKEIASKYNIYPLYNVFNDETAIHLHENKPRKLEDLYKIKGLGEKRISKFGNDIIDFFN